MKKTLAGCVAVALVFAATACGGVSLARVLRRLPSIDRQSIDDPNVDGQPNDHGEPWANVRGAHIFAGPAVEVTISGDEVTPKGDRIDAKVGEPVTFIVQSDRAGGLHVHSSPEQTQSSSRECRSWRLSSTGQGWWRSRNMSLGR